MSVVRIENLSKLYGSAVALRHLDLEVRTGEWVTLLGPSGCGKTTTLRMVAGFAAPTTGKITIGRRVVSDPAARVMVPIERRRLGMVFQAYAVWPHMDVLGNVSYPLRLRRLPRAQREERAQRALAQVRLEEFARRYPHELSGGQQQRVALARALVSDPEVLLLDEPLSALDARLREELRGLLAQLHRETGLTVIFVTHDQDEAIALSDRIVVMNLGEVKQVGSPQEIYSRPVDEFVAGFVGTASLLPVEVQAGRALLAGRPIRTAALKEGGRTAVIRPENVRVHDRGALDGRVLHAWYRGDHFLIALETPAGQLLARAAEAPGSGTVRLDVEDCVVI